MAYNQQHQQGGQYGDQLHGRTDEYGNPVTQLDQYGNPITTAGGGLAGVGSHQGTTGYGTHTHTGGGGGGIGTGTGYGTGGDTGYGSTDQGTAGYGGATGHHEQKGVMDKIKEKIPGTTESGATGTGYGTTTGYGTHGTGTGTGTGGHHEQKGMMDKIKEKIPCATGASGDTTGGAGTGTGQHYTAGGDGRQHHDQYSHGTGEKKGIVDKIKEKLPGGGHSDNKY